MKCYIKIGFEFSTSFIIFKSFALLLKHLEEVLLNWMQAIYCST